jgi:alginate O-acetyltransferase complex protein AlgI
MLFSSVGFGLFLGVSLVAVNRTPARRRWATILALSLAYYATFAQPLLVAILLAVSVVAWIAARGADQAEDDRSRLRWALVGCVTAVAAIILSRLLANSGLWLNQPTTRIRLTSTIGVSFFSLHAISYVLDVYTGRARPERNLGKVLAYLAFFPKLIQGPIERASSLLPQLEAPSMPSYDAIRLAMRLFGLGLFKKVVLADRLAQLVDPIYATPQQYGGLTIALGIYAYAFQLYFDFSGYTDMARATARLFGIELRENFRAPYLASNIADFWRRWHMSFSQWLLDYLFTPLQLAWRRCGRTGTAAAVFLTFTLCGLWHGATWTFFIWGVLHGSYMAGGMLWAARKHRRKSGGGWSRVAGTVLTFHLVTIAWVFFRAPTLDTAGSVLGAAFRPTIGLERLLGQVNPRSAAVTLCTCVIYGTLALVLGYSRMDKVAKMSAVRWAGYVTLFIAILLLRQDTSTSIYSQF